MFCKWCGAESLEEEATQCPRCGKTFSAKSDCGGFYDLVKVTAKTEAPAPVIVPAAPSGGEEPRRGFFPLGYDLFAVIASCAVAVLLVLSIVLLVQVGNLGDKIEDNAQGIANLNSDVEGIDKEQADREESPDKEQADREEEKASFAKWFKNTGLQEAAASQDFKIFAAIGEADQTSMTVCVGPRQETMLYAQTLQKEQLGETLRIENGILSGVEVSLDGDGADLALALTNQRIEELENRGLITVRVEELNEEIFGTQKGDLTFQWKRWNSEENAWDDLEPIRCIQIPLETEDGAPAVGLRYNIERVQSLFADGSADAITLQLTITGENTTDGSLTVVIDGITITQAMLDALAAESGNSAEQTAAE